MNNEELLKLIDLYLNYDVDYATSHILIKPAISVTIVAEGVFSDRTMEEHIYHSINSHINYKQDCRIYFSQLITMEFEKRFDNNSIDYISYMDYMLRYLHDILDTLNKFYIRAYNPASSIEYRNSFLCHKRTLTYYVNSIYKNFCEFNDVYSMNLTNM